MPWGYRMQYHQFYINLKKNILSGVTQVVSLIRFNLLQFHYTILMYLGTPITLHYITYIETVFQYPILQKPLNMSPAEISLIIW